MSRVSRLWRRMSATQPLFRVWSPEGADLNDHQIQSITIDRGAGSPEDGLHATTCEVIANVWGLLRTGERWRVDMTDYGALQLQQMTGGLAAAFKARFYGRVGKQSVDDRHDGRTTTYHAATWQAQINNIDRDMLIAGGTGIWDAAETLLTSSYDELRGWGTTVSRFGTNFDFGVVHERDEDTQSNLLPKYTRDAGVYVQVRRSGDLRLLSKPWRRENAEQRMSERVPITRSQAISPATWDQSREDIRSTHRVIYQTSNGVANVWAGDDPTNPNIPEVENDLRHVRWDQDLTPEIIAWSFRAQELDARFSIPEITIDLLYLLTSESKYHRDQAKELLSMDVGDPLYLSGDWYYLTAGIHFATGIKESISADGWDMTLTLSPSYEIIAGTPYDVPAKVWDSATYPWNDETRRWNAV